MRVAVLRFESKRRSGFWTWVGRDSTALGFRVAFHDNHVIRINGEILCLSAVREKLDLPHAEGAPAERTT